LSDTDPKTASPFDTLADSAERYGTLSLENYSRVRSLAEAISNGFCQYLGGRPEARCCYLVPPEGAWTPQDHQSGAFSVSGQHFLPLAPIRFGLGVRVSRNGDWMRVVLIAAANGTVMDIHIEGGKTYSFETPRNDAVMQAFFAHLVQHLVDWFDDQSRRYEHGEYGGGGGIGFDFLEREEAAKAPPAPEAP
jgi:hypothetical protein